MNSVENILRQRAIKAAKKLDKTEISDALELIYFKIDDEIYAIEASVVSEIHKFKEPMPIPFTPSYICGVFYLRGRFISLVSLVNFLGIGEQKRDSSHSILLLSSESMEFGIMVDEVLEKKKLSKQEIQEIPSGFNLPRADLVIGVTESGTIVLDGKKFLEDSKIVAHEEVN
ncbi:MAG: chemotaxis protein CheW [Campylobacterales bacterium]|nr:chemotaxis protein CheW [Campylobacterales bacterium]